MTGTDAPDRGDLVWIDFDPQAGHEQAGRRPALVVSPGAYNARVKLALLCPITSRVKGYPFEVALPEGLLISGVVLADQVRCVDWRARNCTFVQEAPASVVQEVLARVAPLLTP
ncbi:endoribonuclease MazF [Longimicrobium sp.]|uniref:endoribonuclease MazF n=1 Tax=Longimicrobium sp. TaxID=2029185 RepID=UPI0032C23146